MESSRTSPALSLLPGNKERGMLLIMQLFLIYISDIQLKPAEKKKCVLIEI